MLVLSTFLRGAFPQAGVKMKSMSEERFTPSGAIITRRDQPPFGPPSVAVERLYPGPLEYLQHYESLKTTAERSFFMHAHDAEIRAGLEIRRQQMIESESANALSVEPKKYGYVWLFNQLTTAAERNDFLANCRKEFEAEMNEMTFEVQRRTPDHLKPAKSKGLLSFLG